MRGQYSYPLIIIIYEHVNSKLGRPHTIRHALTANLSPFTSGDLSQIRYCTDFFMVNI